MGKPRLEIGLIIAFIPLVTGATVFCGFLLSRTLNPQNDYTPIVIILSVLVIFLSAVSVTLVIAMVSQAITIVGNFRTGFWPSTSELLQKFAIWLVIRWILIWGLPFASGMSVYIYAIKYYSQYTAAFIGMVAGILLLFVLRKLLPLEIWKISSQFDPFRSLGLKKGIFLFLFLTFVGYIYVHYCYIFEVSLSPRQFNISDKIEVRAHMSGRIINHNALRAKVVAVKSTGWYSEPTAFNIESDGRYVTWIELKKAPPGKYRVVVFFNNYGSKPIHQRFNLWMGHNNLTKTFVVQIREL